MVYWKQEMQRKKGGIYLTLSEWIPENAEGETVKEQLLLRAPSPTPKTEVTESCDRQLPERTWEMEEEEEIYFKINFVWNA